MSYRASVFSSHDAYLCIKKAASHPQLERIKRLNYPEIIESLLD